jgi:hypothetical protein
MLQERIQNEGIGNDELARRWRGDAIEDADALPTPNVGPAAAPGGDRQPESDPAAAEPVSVAAES